MTYDEDNIIIFVVNADVLSISPLSQPAKNIAVSEIALHYALIGLISCASVAVD